MTETEPLSLDLSLLPQAEVRGLAEQSSLRSLASFILEVEGARGAWEIAVSLVSDDELQALHRQFMGIDEPTDIMTFPYGEGVLGGDLAISSDHALARALEWGNSPAQEIEFLVAHGILHLLGWRDSTTGERAAMLARQGELIAAWRNVNGP